MSEIERVFSYWELSVCVCRTMPHLEYLGQSGDNLNRRKWPAKGARVMMAAMVVLGVGLMMFWVRSNEPIKKPIRIRTRRDS